ncbi:hypothetical protein [Cellulomonas sp.]|uniref:hypothetical protein n=1 Tax=Cellulomonas sp. TaxID=40001 RepID=UPI003BAC9A22
MVTDIYGGVEFRHPHHGADYYDGEPWVMAVDLWPLLESGGAAGANPAFAFLFGARNTYGFTPIAERRGLPDDASSAIRGKLEPDLATGELVGSWVAWSELADLDLGGPFGPFVAWVEGTRDGASYQVELVRAGWTPEDLAYCEPPPDLAARALDGPVDWAWDGRTWRFTPMTLGTYLGPGTPWGHVLAVMRALAARYGPNDVRLIAAFD